jgi:hypothetical protein
MATILASRLDLNSGAKLKIDLIGGYMVGL